MKKSFLLATLLLLVVGACTDATKAKLTGFGSTYKVEVLSGGSIVRTYTSSGKVQSEAHSDGYYFNDAATGELVEVSGQLIITQRK